MKKSLFFLLFFLFFQFVSAENAQKYDEKSFDTLFKAVSKHYSKEELRKIVEESLQPDELTEKNLAFIRFHYPDNVLKKDTFACSALADDSSYAPFLDVEVYPVQDPVLPERFAEFPDFNYRFRHYIPSNLMNKKVIT